MARIAPNERKRPAEMPNSTHDGIFAQQYLDHENATEFGNDDVTLQFEYPVTNGQGIICGGKVPARHPMY